MSLPNKCRILGVDISKSSTGWSIVDVDSSNGEPKLKLVDYGFIPTKSMNHGQSLIAIEKKLELIISTYKPTNVAIEAMFVGKNAGTGMTLANAHGVVLLVCAKNNLTYNYYSVMTLKSKTLGGIKTKKEDGTKKTGDEMKEEVSRKIIEIFGANSFTKELNNDVTDSISAAYTFVVMDGLEIEKPKKTKKKKTT
jgi:crossover junction endodeoxyribonuclease RuvC